MSGRGGRGGRGGGRGGRGGGRDMPMGNVSFQEMQDSMRKPQQLNNQSTDILPTLAPATSKELRDAMFQLSYLRHQRFSPYWPTLNASKATSASGTKAAAAAAAVTGVQTSSSGVGATKPSLNDVKLQKEVFPQDVWRVHMDGENRRAQRAARRQARSKVDWTVFDAAGAGEAAGIGDAANEGALGADSAEEMDDYEDELDDDYNQNYFDPGDEDGEDGDDGGDEGGGTYE